MELHKKLFVAALLCANSLTAFATQDMIVWDRLKDNPVAYKILELALDRTVSSHGAYRLVSSHKMEQDRAVIQLTQNEAIDIANFAPDAEREKKLLPIRIPVTQGLLGYRVCLINKNAQSKFDGIKSLESWRNRGLKIGQGKGWPDTAILEANDLSVVKSPKYNPLFAMLKKGRFDCFSRSISEVTPELKNHTDIALEENILLVYRLPTFFFVSKEAPDLASRIEQGLLMAYEEGSVQNLLHSHYETVFKAMNISKRTLIHLDNPYLTEESKAALNQFSHWLDIKAY